MFIRKMVRHDTSIFTEELDAPTSDRLQVVNHILSTGFNQSKFLLRCLLSGHQQYQQKAASHLSDTVFKFNVYVLLMDAVLVLFMIRIFAFFLKHLKQPKVVCEVMGGIIIGPSVLSINHKFKGIFFPENAEYVIRNIGLMGFMYFLFIIGVKMDLSMIRISRKRHRVIAFIGTIIPLVAGSTIGIIIRPSMDKELAKSYSIGAVVSSMALNGFVVIYPILQELNLLSSEIGQLALSIAIITDAAAFFLLTICKTLSRIDYGLKASLWYTISIIAFMSISFTTLRRAMKWILEKTPEGQPVQQAYVVLILLGVLVMGFLSDMVGMGVATGSLWLGLAIPDGPPLGSTIVERTETFIMEFFMPLSYIYIGMFVDVFAMASVPGSSLTPLLTLATTSIILRLVATLVASLFFNLPLRDALTLSLILNLRGQQELVLIMHWMDASIIKIPSFTMMVLLVTAVTAISTPLIGFLYDPSRPYMVNTRRTVQHTPQHEELKIAACIHNQDSVASLVHLFELSCPSPMNPLSLYALHLIKLIGRAAPVFIDNEKQEMPSNYAAHEVTTNKALNLFKETNNDSVELHFFTAIVPEKTMYQDICKMAMKNEVSLIILPLHDDWIDYLTNELKHPQTPSVISNVLDHAPCSVGILVDKGRFFNPCFDRWSCSSTGNLLVLFLGGADAREALYYADRMINKPNVYVTVIRLLSHRCSREYQKEQKLDDGVITWFWARNERNKQVAYSTVVVNNGEETLEAIQEIGKDARFDLWIMGRKQGINPVLLEGLSDWSEHDELGAIGDYVSSKDYDAAASVLVVQQQILRG